MIGRTSTISDLGLCILQRILSYLRYVDKLKMLFVTKCIAKLAEEIFDSEPFDILHVQIHFSVEELKQLLIDYGRYIKQLRYTEWLSDETNIAYAKLLPEHCTNLQQVYFANLEITTSNIYGQILISAQKTIEKLTLESCIVRDPACSLVANLSILKVLNLQYSKLSGEDLGRLKNLTELNLRECENFRSGNFIDILKSNKLVKLNLGRFATSDNVEDMLLKTQPNLKVLTVSNLRPQICGMKTLREISMDMCFDEYVAEYLEELVSNRVPIESLEITKSFLKSLHVVDVLGRWIEIIIDPIIQMDNLRALSFHNIRPLGNSVLVKIVKCCRSIEMLDLYGTSVNDRGIIGCMGYLKELRHLDLSYCTVEKSLYSRLVKIRNELGIVQKLVVYIRPQKALEAVLKSDVYPETMDFVQLTLSPMRTVSDSSLLERLKHLNLSYCNDNPNLIQKAARSTKRFSSQVPSLLALDDNCLYHVMKYLPLVDQLKLTLSNSRFEYIIKYFFSTNLFQFGEFVESFTVREATNLLSRCGHMVKKLYIKRADCYFDAECYDLMCKYFTNVVELSSVEVMLSMTVISNSLNSLEEIHMIECNIDDVVAMEISKAAKLHTLNFASSILSGGIHFGNLKNLTSVHLPDVQHLEPATFIAICKSNRLKTLNIIGCAKLNDQSFQILVETQSNLERLAIGGKYAATNIYLVAWLKKLKDLKFHNLSRVELLPCIDALAELKCDKLEYLEISGNHIVYNPTEGLRIAENFAVLQNLIYFRVSLNRAINIDFIRIIAKGCRLLKSLDLCSWEPVYEDEVLEVIRLFKHLRHLDIDCSKIRVIAIYREALEIMKEADRGSLLLHCGSSIDFILEMEKIREYIVNKKYVKLSIIKYWNPSKFKLANEETRQSQDKAETRQSHTKEVASSMPGIIDIPDSCLQRIASYLQPVDRLVFAYLHKTICVSIGTALDNLLHNLNDIARIFTVSEARDIFAACAGHIKRMQFSTIGNTLLMDYINLLQPYCSYVIEIDITWHGGKLCDELIKLFGAKDLKLQKLTAKDHSLHVSALKHFTSIPTVGSIYSLDVSNTGGVRFLEQYIDMLKHLTDLNLMHCSELENKYFQSICHNCKLKRLNIIGVCSLDESSFKMLVETQNNHLKQLSMSCRYKACNYTEVAKLKNLRRITIEIDVPLPVFKILLKTLVRYRRSDLQALEIINTTQLSEFEFRIYDMVKEVKSYFQRLKNIAIKVKTNMFIPRVSKSIYIISQ